MDHSTIRPRVVLLEESTIHHLSRRRSIVRPAKYLYLPPRPSPKPIKKTPNKRRTKTSRTNWKLYKCPELRVELQKRGLSPKGKKDTMARRLQWSDQQLSCSARDSPLWWRFRTCKQLRAECESRGLSTQGKQKSLFHRLEVSDRILKETQLGIFPIFPQFSRLPAELRIMIWEYTLPGPRGIAVDVHRHSLFSPIQYRSPNPVALSICTESREIALKRYQPFLGLEEVYADFEHGDFLYFGDWCHQGRFIVESTSSLHKLTTKWKQSSSLTQIKSIALGYQVWSAFCQQRGAYAYERRLTQGLTKFENLLEVALVLGEQDDEIPVGYENGIEFFKRDYSDAQIEESQSERGTRAKKLVERAKLVDSHTGRITQEMPGVKFVRMATRGLGEIDEGSERTGL